MYRPCMHCDNGRYDPNECPEICKYGEDRKKLAAYEDLGELDHLRELAEAEKDGRLIVKPAGEVTEADGNAALKKAMYENGVKNNGVTRYTADAIIDKLTREEAKAALKGGRA